MGLVSDQRKLIKARLYLSSLKYDLGHVTNPGLRKFVVSQIVTGEKYLEKLSWKVNMCSTLQAPTIQPLPEKKAPPAEATKIVKKKKIIDEQNRFRIK